MTELIPGNLYTYRNSNAPLWDGTTVRYVGEIVPPFGRSDADIVRVDTGASGICPSDLLHELECTHPDAESRDGDDYCTTCGANVSDGSTHRDPRDVALDDIAAAVRPRICASVAELEDIILAVLARVGR